MIKSFLVILATFVFTQNKEVERMEPRSSNYTAPPQQITLAITQKVSIPLFGAISEQILFVPNTSKECSFSNIQTKYNQIASRSLERPQNSIVTSILPLKAKGLLFIIDQFFYLSAFELTKDQNIKELVPTRKIHSQTSKSQGSNPKLVATQDQETVYIMSSFGYSYFNVNSLSTELKNLKQRAHQSEQIFKLQIFNKKLYVASGVGGIKIYKIQEDKQLKYMYNIVQKDIYCTDFSIDQSKRLLYVMDKIFGIYVYDISEQTEDRKQIIDLDKNASHSQKNAKKQSSAQTKPNPLPKKDGTPVFSDFLNISQYATNNLDIEVFQNTILILFSMNNRNIVAELHYDPIDKSYTFVRYFKFQAGISEIIILKNNFVTIGNQFLGIFPVNIHPRLIKKQLNGFVSISEIKTAVAFSPPYFVGVTTTHIIIAQVKTQKYQVIECTLKQKSELEKIVYRANLTTCSSDSPRKYYEYCQYQKQFFINKMQIVARQQVANFIWVLLAIFTTAIVGGVITLLIMRHLKVKRIKRLQQEFQEKRRNVALPSDRISARVGQNSQKLQTMTQNVNSEAPMTV